MEGGETLKHVGLRSKASSFDPCWYYIREPNGRPVGTITAHIDGILGCGDAGAPSLAQFYLERRFGEWEIREAPLTQLGMELYQGKDFSAATTQEEFTRELELMPTALKLWADRPRPISVDEAPAGV